MFLVTLVVVLIMIAISFKSSELREKIEGVDAKISQLNQQIASEEQRSEEIEEYRKYTETKGYVEEVAKDKLGLVYEGEIVFKEED
jgi:cell division protein DivIC